MDSHLYVDQYLRRKRGVAFPAGSTQQQQLSAAAHNAIFAAANLRNPAGASTVTVTEAPSAPTVVHHHAPPSVDVQRALTEHADVVRDLAVTVQAFVERTDNLNLQVQTVEDKVLNLTKMLKVSQDIGDEQSQTLAEQITELRKAIDVVKDDEQRTRIELADLRSSVPQLIREAVATVKADVRVEMESMKATIQSLEKQQLMMRAELMSQFTTTAENIVSVRIHHEAERTAALLKETQAKIANDVQGLDREFTARLNERKAFLEAEIRNLSRRSGGEEVTFEAVRRIAEERITAMQALTRDHHQTELRQALLAAQNATREDFARSVGRLEEELKDLASRVKHAEEHSSNIEGSFQEFIGAFKEHTGHQAARMEETAVHMRELMELHDETRNVVAAELETTKQWATRNMTRLKKHIDNTNVDVTALKDAHRDVHQMVERMRLAQSDERNRLADLVEQRTREAAALSDMVDREITSVQNIARTYRNAPRGRSVDSLRVAGGRTRVSLSSQEDVDQPTAAGQSEDLDDDDEVFEQFAKRTAERRKKMQALYAELKTDIQKPVQ